MSMPFPPQIQLPPETPASRGGPDDISSPRQGNLLDHLEDALDSLHEYLRLEGDSEDKAQAMKLISGVQSLLARHQSSTLKAMGAGPGVALVEKQRQRDAIANGGY